MLQSAADDTTYLKQPGWSSDQGLYSPSCLAIALTLSVEGQPGEGGKRRMVRSFRLRFSFFDAGTGMSCRVSCGPDKRAQSPRQLARRRSFRAGDQKKDSLFEGSVVRQRFSQRRYAESWCLSAALLGYTRRKKNDRDG